MLVFGDPFLGGAEPLERPLPVGNRLVPLLFRCLPLRDRLFLVLDGLSRQLLGGPAFGSGPTTLANLASWRP